MVLFHVNMVLLIFLFCDSTCWIGEGIERNYQWTETNAKYLTINLAILEGICCLVWLETHSFLFMSCYTLRAQLLTSIFFPRIRTSVHIIVLEKRVYNTRVPLPAVSFCVRYIMKNNVPNPWLSWRRPSPAPAHVARVLRPESIGRLRPWWCAVGRRRSMSTPGNILRSVPSIVARRQGRRGSPCHFADRRCTLTAIGATKRASFGRLVELAARAFAGYSTTPHGRTGTLQ